MACILVPSNRIFRTLSESWRFHNGCLKLILSPDKKNECLRNPSASSCTPWFMHWYYPMILIYTYFDLHRFPCLQIWLPVLVAGCPWWCFKTCWFSEDHDNYIWVWEFLERNDVYFGIQQKRRQIKQFCWKCWSSLCI